MRIISGTARGTKIASIEDISTRPTLDRVRESLFNILQTEIRDKIILDLFAGSGALGIEALSRGAQRAYFCDNNVEAIKYIKNNLKKTNLIDKAIIYNKDYTKCINDMTSKFDIIFIDPPYKLDLAVDAIEKIVKKKLVAKDGIIILETDEVNRDISELEKDKNIKIVDRRKYGRANLIFVKEILQKNEASLD